MCAAVLLYLYGVGMAIYITYTDVPPTGQTELILNPNIVFIVTSIGGVLATNFGAIVGLPAPELSKSIRLDGDGPKKVQIIAAYIYVIGLVTALVSWMLESFSEDPKEVVALIPELSKTLIGVFVGTLAVHLGKK